MPNTDNHAIVEHLFRTEYGKLVATLTRIFGASYIELAEDIVQDTLISALDHWSIHKMPENPAAWLTQVAKRKVLNELKRNKMKAQHHEHFALQNYSTEDLQNIFLDHEIEDSQLRMIFTCCHPTLAFESQIALILKTLCGLGVQEVANALLSNQSTINKRLYRAKVTIRNSEIPFDIPQGKELDKSIDTVCLTLYLLFNEGYNSRSNNAVIQKDLCLEAMRLTQLLGEHFQDHKRIYALLSLMCFHTARFDARIDDHGAIVLFEDQNRDYWNRELIAFGIQHLKYSMNAQSLSEYHIEANIAAEHCMASDFKHTNWQSIFDLYTMLEKLKPNPIIKLNLAIIESELKGIPYSLQKLAHLSENSNLNDYHLLSATQGVFNMKIGKYLTALPFLQKAIKMNISETERNLLELKIKECKKGLSLNS